MKFSEGQQVRIASHLSDSNCPCWEYVYEMSEFEGKLTVITSARIIKGHAAYHVAIDNEFYMWEDANLVSVQQGIFINLL